MNRIIRFRGKRLDTSEWIYGDLIQYADKSYAIFSSPLSKYGYEATEICRRDAVDPSTVGQFTGLLDKNGKEIYEGDIINLINADGKSINVVCEFGTARRDIFENTVDITGFYFKLSNGKKTFPIVHNYAGKHDLELFEVIGDIHDNPELLKEVQ